MHIFRIDPTQCDTHCDELQLLVSTEFIVHLIWEFWLPYYSRFFKGFAKFDQNVEIISKRKYFCC